ncbi:MAG: hypothetical protein ACT443_08245 [Gemmatimonadota bacterium]
MHLQTTKTLQIRNCGCESRCESERFDLSIQLIAPRDLVLEQREVFAVDESILGCERRIRRRQMAQPEEVLAAPVATLAIDEAAACEKLENIVA